MSELVEACIRKTNEGRMVWEPGDGADSFVYIASSWSLVIYPQAQGLSPTPALQLFDKSGDLKKSLMGINTITSLVAGVGAKSDDVRAAMQLSELYAAASDSARGVDDFVRDALDEIEGL